MDTNKLTTEQKELIFAEFFNTVIELDRKMKTVISNMIELEHKELKQRVL
jgi:hypothetical protein